MKLKVKQSSWSGWVLDYKPEEVENEYEIKLQEKYVIKTREVSYIKDDKLIEEIVESFSFEIKEINSDSLQIHTFQSFVNMEGNRTNLESNNHDFIVSYEQPLKLVTPTKDAGEIFILTLVD